MHVSLFFFLPVVANCVIHFDELLLLDHACLSLQSKIEKDFSYSYLINFHLRDVAENGDHQ